jgi:hypothetical protein
LVQRAPRLRRHAVKLVFSPVIPQVKTASWPSKRLPPSSRA